MKIINQSLLGPMLIDAELGKEATIRSSTTAIIRRLKVETT
jgi:hypothetical protein